MNNHISIRPCSLERIDDYGRIYAEAFAGSPWNDWWAIEDATTHVREALEQSRSYGLECVVEGEVAGFILGSSLLFHDGRVFEISDLAVARNRQHKGIATMLMNALMAEVRRRGFKRVHLITAREGMLPEFYERFGFERESEVILMGMTLDH